MKRYIFYLAISLSAFGIGVSFVYFYFYRNTKVLNEFSERIEKEILQNEVSTSQLLKEIMDRTENWTQKDEIELLYGPTIEQWLKGEKPPDIVEPSPEIIKRASETKLSYYLHEFLFNSAKKSYKTSLVDLNSDGENELVIIVEGNSFNMSDLRILKKSLNDFDIILDEYPLTEKFKLLKNKHKGHFDIEISSGYSDEEEFIRKDFFRFDGQEYFYLGCYAYIYRYKDKNGKWRNLKKPVLERLNSCC